MASGHTVSPHSEFRLNENWKQKTYAFWQTNNGIHWAVTLKELVTVWIVVHAHQLDVLL
jgi:hypothetical protein